MCQEPNIDIWFPTPFLLPLWGRRSNIRPFPIIMASDLPGEYRSVFNQLPGQRHSRLNKVINDLRNLAFQLGVFGSDGIRDLLIILASE